MLSLTLWKVLLADVPRDEIAVKHTTTISASITAYSTAVGPSSEARKRCNFKASDLIQFLQDKRDMFDWDRVHPRNQPGKRGTDGTRRLPATSACPVPSASRQQPKPRCLFPVCRDAHRAFARCAPPQPARPGCRQADVQDHPGLHHPFGSPATVFSRTRPVALRPGLATGLPLSRMRRQAVPDRGPSGQSTRVFTPVS